MIIQTRQRIEVNTDPQMRCYNGCHAKSELIWTPWENLEFDIPEEALQDRLTFWRELNEYAVSQRGASALREYREVEDV